MNVKMNGENQEGSTGMQWLLAILVNITMLSYGMQCGWISCSAAALQSAASAAGRALSDSEVAWLASLPSITATFCVAIFTVFVDKFGRKPCFIAVAIFQLICWAIKLCPSNFTSLMVARVSSGIAGGGCFIVVPMYVKEISEDRIRGTLGVILIMAQNIGILIMYAMGGYLSYDLVLWISVAIPLLNVVLFVKAPESPSFLVKMSKVEEATAAIAFLRGRAVDDKVVQSEIEAIKSEEERFKSIPNISYIQILKHKPWRKGFLFMVLLMVCHGLNGGFSIVNYAASTLAKLRVTVSPELQSLSIPVFMIFGSLISLATVERVGRKMILGTCFLLSMVAFLSLGMILVLQRGGAAVSPALPVAAVVLAVAAYAGAVSPLPFLIMSEMFSFQLRARVMGVLVTLGWLFSFVQLFAFVPVSIHFGDHMIFVCFAVMNLCGVIVTVVLLPETRNKSVDQIEMELERRLERKK